MPRQIPHFSAEEATVCCHVKVDGAIDMMNRKILVGPIISSGRRSRLETRGPSPVHSLSLNPINYLAAEDLISEAN